MVGVGDDREVLLACPHRLRPVLHHLFSGYHVGRDHLPPYLTHEVAVEEGREREGRERGGRKEGREGERENRKER